MRKKFVYAYNQKEAMEEVRSKAIVPLKAKMAGTKHNMKVYKVWFRNRKKK